MKIGIDFDNTIVKYDEIFVKAAKEKNFVSSTWLGNKETLKQKLNGKKNQWEKIQGIVYGPSMRNAICFPGLKKFLIKTNFSGHQVFIISHKTIYGHFDKTKTRLRDQALLWLEQEDFFNSEFISLKKENIFFCDDRERKIKKINELNLDFMIDDLDEIFENNALPKTKNILFSATATITNASYICKNWDQISSLILTEKNNKKSLIKLCNKLYNRKSIKSIVKLKKGGNSRVYKMTDHENNFYILKEYPNHQLRTKPRLMNEVSALKLLYHTDKVPEVIYYDHDINISVLEFINGTPVKKVTNQNIYDALNFIQEMFNLSKTNKFKSTLATEACLNANELIGQIENRFNKLQLIKNDKLQYTLKKLYDLYLQLLKRAYKTWPKNNINKSLNKNFMTFSPSDFGFHNSILNKSKELKFIDFEYFGLDDPVKLIADFLWHPGMTLDEKQKILFTKNVLKIFNKDEYLRERLNASFSLYGIRWALIILNDFLSEKMFLCIQPNLYKNERSEIHLNVQLDKSMKIYNNIIYNNMECNYAT